MKCTRNAVILILSMSFVLLSSLCTYAQLISSRTHGAFDSYRSCSFADGLQIVQSDSLAPGITERGVMTPEGSKLIQMQVGTRMLFAYPGTDVFANVKAEQLPTETWNAEKKILEENFAYLLRSSPDFRDDVVSDQNLVRLDAKGMTKTSLSGGVLALYLLFNDSSHIVTTIYLVNQEPTSRKFQTLDGFHRLKTHFLHAYAACISGATK